MARARHVIALTASQTSYLGEKALRLSENYADAVIAAGGVPLVLPLADVSDPAAQRACDAALDMADGLLLTGGHDIDPGRYRHGGMRDGDDALASETTPARDALELRLLARAEERDMPVLGICRGMQLMNVARGGTLYLDLEAQHEPRPGSNPVKHDEHMDGRLAHAVGLEPGTQLARIVGAPELRVNSLHHQAVRDLGRRLVATATAPDGVVEALEDPTHPFMLGVQWHPEYSATEKPMANIFEAFLAAATAFGSTQPSPAQAPAQQRQEAGVSL